MNGGREWGGLPGSPKSPLKFVVLNRQQEQPDSLGISPTVLIRTVAGVEGAHTQPKQARGFPKMRIRGLALNVRESFY